MMKDRMILLSFLTAFFLTAISGCELVGDIFEAGFWAGILIVVGIIVLIFYIIFRMRRKP